MMDRLKNQFAIGWMAKQFNVARSGYYAWVERQKNPGKREKENAELTARIKIIFHDKKNIMVRLVFTLNFELMTTM